jgi:hypothetical protein
MMEVELGSSDCYLSYRRISNAIWSASSVIHFIELQGL